MVCPYNEFKECFKEKCPFYDYSIEVISGHYVTLEYCGRAEKEKRKK